LHVIFHANILFLELWEIGHELFRSTSETFPVPFVGGDLFDDEYVSEQPVLPTGSSPPWPRPADLHTLTSLNPLRGHVSALFAGAFFHLFDEDGQARAARRLAGLLSPEPGSMLMGVQGGMLERGIRQPHPDFPMFCHSPVTWRKMWDDVFGENKIQVRTHLRVQDGGKDIFGMYPDNQTELYVNMWSVTRL
jgi:hypothetical protein